MEYRTLGRSGCAVSRLALGTMTFGKETDEAGAHEQLDAFVEAGGNLVDTADVYTAGASEEIIGRWLERPPGRRHRQVVLATKGRFPMGAGRNDVGPVPPAPPARAGRLAAPARRRLRRPLPGARLGPGHPARGDAADPRRRRRAPARSATSGCRTSPAGRCRRPSRWRPPRGCAGR